MLHLHNLSKLRLCRCNTHRPKREREREREREKKKKKKKKGLNAPSTLMKGAPASFASRLPTRRPTRAAPDPATATGSQLSAALLTTTNHDCSCCRFGHCYNIKRYNENKLKTIARNPCPLPIKTH
jgi:hypothetical protein